MTSAQIAVIVTVASFSLSTATLSAQPDAGTRLTIQVTDIAGVPISEAQVNVMSPEDGRLLAFTTDGQGIADIHLQPGEYQYRVASSGFCPKNGTATIDPVWPLEVSARLTVISCPGPCSHPCVTPIGSEPLGHPVTIKVSDPSGAVVPGALVEIEPPTPSFRLFKTDGNGQAAIGLPPGMYSLTVSAFGFRRWKGFAEVQDTEEAITAKLHLAGNADPEISIEPSGVDLPLYMPQPNLIALQPEETLPLPAVSVRKHNRRH